MLCAFGQYVNMAKHTAHLTNLPDAQNVANCTAQTTNIHLYRYCVSSRFLLVIFKWHFV